MNLPTNILPATSANDLVLSHANQHNQANTKINDHESRIVTVEGLTASEAVSISVNTTNIS